MLNTIGIVIALVALFYAIGKLADIVVVNVRTIGQRLGIKVFFLGLIVGLLTSAPEFFIGVQALAQDTPEISLGNLIGGIIVLFGLILGGSILLNRRITTDGKIWNILPVAFYLALPLFLGLDGELSFVDGFLFLVSYFLIVLHIYKTNKVESGGHRFELEHHKLLKKMFVSLVGIVGVIVLSNLIVRLALLLVQNLSISPFIIGLLFFGVGTNLPEITVTIRSWYRHIRELSFAHLIGSAMANILIMGIFALARPLPVAVGGTYYVLLAIFLLLLGFLVWAYESDRAFTRREGFLFLGFYVVFLVTQILFLVFSI